jgi:hypothetical protein
MQPFKVIRIYYKDKELFLFLIITLTESKMSGLFKIYPNDDKNFP